MLLLEVGCGQRCVDLGRIGGQGDLAQEAVCSADVELRPTAVGDCQVLCEGLLRLVVLSSQPIPFAEEQRKNLAPYTWPVARCLGTTWARTSTPRCGSPARHADPGEGGLSPRLRPQALRLSGPPAPHIQAPAPGRLAKYKLLRGRWPRRRGHCCLQIPHSRAAPLEALCYCLLPTTQPGVGQ